MTNVGCNSLPLQKLCGGSKEVFVSARSCFDDEPAQTADSGGTVNPLWPVSLACRLTCVFPSLLFVCFLAEELGWDGLSACDPRMIRVVTEVTGTGSRVSWAVLKTGTEESGPPHSGESRSS